MSSIRLPCHKGLARGTNEARTNNCGARLRPGQIPYVSHDNGKTRYYADRYYMDAPTALLEYQLEQQQKKRDDKIDYCDYCGEKRQCETNANGKSGSPARPLFDRAAFVNSLDLSAAIIATYTMGDLEFLSDTFPALFPHPGRTCKQHVPTLVLHGHRGWKLPTERTSDKDNVKCPDEWEVEQDEASSELQGNAEANEKESDDNCAVASAAMKNKAEPTISTLKKTKTPPKTATTHSSIKSEKENVHSQSSPAKSDNVAFDSSETDTIYRSATTQPALTYQGLSLNIKSARKRKRKTSQSNKVVLSPRRSPRLSPSRNKRSQSPVSQQFSQSPRRSPRLNPAIKHEKDVPNVQKLAQVGATAMDAINLGSDTEDDECNVMPTPMKNEVDANLDCTNDKTIYETAYGMHTPPSSPSRNHAKQFDLPTSHATENKLNEQCDPPESKPSLHPNAGRSRKRLQMSAASPASSSAASILARSFGSIPDAKLMKPLHCAGDASDTSDDDSVGESQYALKSDACIAKNQDGQTDKAAATKENGAKSASPASVFGGEVFFTQVLPRWIPPKDKKSTKKKQCSTDGGAPKLETVRGCHHPKFFLLFEKSGSLVVIVSTCNLTPQHAVDASWVQRFEPRSIVESNGGDVDYGMTHDFGYVLADLMNKQSDAAENGMLPDEFLRRYVDGLSSGLADLPRRYKFEDSHVHLVSTVPGDYMGHLPKKGVASCYNRPPYRHPSITYGPQRVAYILSRVMDKNHISVACATIPRGLGSAGSGGTAAVTPWLPPSLLIKNERLVIQPTSMSGTWDRWELEIIAKSLLEPHWKSDGVNGYNSPVELLDIVWPSMGHFDLMRQKRRALKEKHKAESSVLSNKKFEKNTRGPCHVFLSSMAFSKLDRVCISRMALFEHSHQPHLNSYETTSLHFKSFCRMLKLTCDKPSLTRAADPTKSSLSRNQRYPKEQEHISWFMLTSACLSKGAQGQPTPFRSLDSDSMSYANFELGVMFCSRILGDRVNDRLYVYDNEFSGGCQCGTGKRWYKDLLKNGDPDKPPAFLDSVRKVHIPIPYQLRPKPYQQDPESDFMSYTPYLHEIPPGTGAVGNMKLTPYGRNVTSSSVK